MERALEVKRRGAAPPKFAEQPGFCERKLYDPRGQPGANTELVRDSALAAYASAAEEAGRDTVFAPGGSPERAGGRRPSTRSKRATTIVSKS